jgi:hypothetical protein
MTEEGMFKMARIMAYKDDYFNICEMTKRKTIIYGAGAYARKAFPYLKNVSFVCDKRADEVRILNGVTVISPEALETIEEAVLVVICIKAEKIRSEIKLQLGNLQKDIWIFDYFDNVAFDIYKERQLINGAKGKTIRYVHLISEDSGWILHKFAWKMKEVLETMEYKCTIGSAVDPLADINHHVSYASCEPVTSGYNETFMITHIDSYNKMEFLKHQMRNAKMGICMSRETMERLAAYGMPREKICYINPAQDGVIKPKKYILGITHKTHEDHRKNEHMLVELCRYIDSDYFAFKIMGAGWGQIVNTVRDMGFQVDYYDEFDYGEYVRLMPSLDYYLFWGFDEGSMGFLDALQAGVETIVTPQGYHLDVKDGITYACRTLSDFITVLLELQEKRKRTVGSVSAWTWDNYVSKHLEIWNYLLGNEDGIYKNQHMYEDGIFSVLKYNV